MSVAKKISQLTPATSVATNDYTVLVDGSTSANKRATVAQIMAIAGGGTVTSVNASGTQGVTVSGGPVTSSGSLSVGLGAITPASVAASGTVTGFNLSGTNTGDQTIQLLGDVEAAGGTGNLTTVIATGAVTNSKLANMTGPTVKGRTSGTGTPSDVTMAQLNGMLPTFVPDSGTGGTTGLVPAPGAGDAAQKKFLRADGAWAKTDLNDILPTQTGNAGKVLSTTGTTTQWLAAPGVGTVTSVNVAGDGNITASGGPVTAAGTISVALSNTAVTPATYGSASAVPVLSIDEKGRITSASTASLGTLATQNASSVTLSGGTINGTAIGGSTPAAGSFTTLASNNTTTLNGTTIPASSTLLVSGGALGTPSSGTVTNLTGTASININGTVGATTPSTGAFTTISGTTSALVSNNGDTSSANYPSVSTRLGSSFDGQNIMTMLSYGANTAMVQGVAGGTKASPTATQSGNLLSIFAGLGYDATTGWGNGTGTASSRITFAAAENFTNAAQGSYITFDTTPAGSTIASRAERMRLDANGLGIGATPVAKLHVLGVGATPPTSGTTCGGVVRIASSNNNCLDIGQLSGVNGSWIQAYDTTDLQYEYSLLLNPNGGNVGIGTTTASHKLHVSGTGADIAATDSTVGTRIISSAVSSIGIIETSSNHPLVIRSNQAERARVDANDLTLSVALKLSNAYTAGAPTATGYLVVKDSSGTSYKIPAVAL